MRSSGASPGGTGRRPPGPSNAVFVIVVLLIVLILSLIIIRLMIRLLVLSVAVCHTVQV